MDYKQFKKELFEEMRATLKPHGFAKYGPRFRCARENGIACMVEVQSSHFGESLTINVFFGAVPVPVTAESWNGFRNSPPWEGNLGQSLEDGWNHSYWIDPYDEDDPRVVDGYIISWCCQKDGLSHEWKSPAPTPQQAKAQVCGLLQNKLLPLFDSLQTPEDYVRFSKTAKECSWFAFGERRTPAVCRLYAQVVEASELLPGIEEYIQFHTKVRDNYYKELRELEEQIAQSRRKKPNKGQLIVQTNLEKFIRQREQLVAEYEALRKELMTASNQKE